MGSETSEKNSGFTMTSTKNEESAAKPMARVYGQIVISLENCLLPDTKLEQTPSQLDGLDRETEIDLRILGCELIQTAGILLKLPQVGTISLICH